MNTALKAKHNVKEVVPFLHVSSMELSIRFYLDGIGFTIKHKWVVEGKLRWCWLSLGGASLMLQEFPKEGHDSWAPAGKVSEGVSLYFTCEDAIAIYKELNRAGSWTQISIFRPAGSVWSVATLRPSGDRRTLNHKLGIYLYLKNTDGSGSEEEVTDLGAASTGIAWDWSRDSKYVLVKKVNELWYISWPERVAKPQLQAKWTVWNAQFSPDGRWIAYPSNETGSKEIYVSPFLGGNGKWQVSSAGGQEPRWRQDGKELFYLSADGKMMAAAVKTGASFEAGSPIALFQTHRRQPISSLDVFAYDVSGDGQRFLIITKVDEANAAPLSVHLNWASEMDK